MSEGEQVIRYDGAIYIVRKVNRQGRPTNVESADGRDSVFFGSAWAYRYWLGQETT
jgi:hypothetical protein